MLLGLFLASRHSQAASLKIEGELEYTMTVPGHQMPPSLQKFTIHVDGCKWLMRIIEQSGNNPSTNSIGCDGTNVYAIAYLPKAEANFNFGARGEKSTESNGKPAPNQATGMVIPGIIPPTGEISAGAIWLAYLSNCYFDSIKSNTVRLPYVGLDYPTPMMRYSNYSLPAIVKRSASEPGLPEFLEYKNEGVSYTEVAGSLITNILQKPYTQGYTLARLATESWISSESMHFPQSATFLRYGRKKVAASAADLNIYVTIKLTTSKIAQIASLSDYRPAIDVKIAIADLRTANASSRYPIWYMLTNGHDWLSVEKVISLPSYQRQVQSKVRINDASDLVEATGKPAISSIFLILLLTPSLVFIFYLYKSKPK